MRTTQQTRFLSMAVEVMRIVAVTACLAGCGGSNAAPSVAPSPTPAPTPSQPSPSPAPAPGPSPLPSPPPAPTFTVSGVVLDGDGETGLSQVTVSLLQQPTRGVSVYVPAAATDGSGRYAIPTPTTVPSIQFSRPGFITTSRTLQIAADTTMNVLLPRDCTIRPNGLTASVSQTFVQFSWAPVVEATDYMLEVGTAPPRTDSPFWIAPDVMSTRVGGTTAYRWNTPRGGTFIVRALSRTSCGWSAPSDEVRFAPE